jgi:hypothetical protein
MSDEYAPTLASLSVTHVYYVSFYANFPTLSLSLSFSSKLAK